MPDEKPLKFPDLPADHPANATVVVEPTQAQTDPVTSEASATTDTPEDDKSSSAPPDPSTEAENEGTSEGTLEQPVPTEPGDPNASDPPAVDSAGQPLEQDLPARVIVGSGVAHDGAVYRARSDNDVLTNSFCKVIAGPYTGRYGVFWSTASLGADGWPSEVVVRTRDAEDENIVVNYADIRPDVAGRR